MRHASILLPVELINKCVHVCMYCYRRSVLISCVFYTLLTGLISWHVELELSNPCVLSFTSDIVERYAKTDIIKTHVSCHEILSIDACVCVRNLEDDKVWVIFMLHCRRTVFRKQNQKP